MLFAARNVSRKPNPSSRPSSSVKTLFQGTVCRSLALFSLIARPSCRPHYASCPSGCPSVRLSVLYGLLTRKQKKYLIRSNVPQGTSKWSANFQMKMSKVKVRRTSKKSTTVWCHVYLLAADQAPAVQPPTAN